MTNNKKLNEARNKYGNGGFAEDFDMGFKAGYLAAQKEAEGFLEQLKTVLEKHDSHSQAYSTDIFPDDGRKPCETTSGRMGRHMIKCYEDYLKPLREFIKKYESGGE
ncbi:hypothetical protein UFOVP610_38 [uncultured Caudovirales phage]|uniref:Uncharacterized protein n=1 Tax=uncultured Caudovirales phage TaxID=2100421 RepID=A0A6J5N1L2_9CAUD|nr:hypothetical protein UFOVP610_38 [uncultured Caudovirales phage]